MKNRFLRTFLIASVSLLFLPFADVRANTIPEGEPDIGMEAEPVAETGYGESEETVSQPESPGDDADNNIEDTDSIPPFDEAGGGADEGTTDEDTVCVHTPAEEWVIQNPPTCTEEGIENQICENCGEVLDSRALPSPGHDWELEWTTDLEPTCTEPGSKSHHCTACDEKDEITEVEPLKHKVQTTEWELDENSHWHECERCKAHLDEAKHGESDWILDREPDYGIPGIRHTQCPICKTIIQYEEIPELIKPGIVDKDVEKTDDTAPDISFNNSLEELKEKLLDEDDLERIENGESVKIYLEAKSLDSEAAEKAKAQIAEVAEEAEEIRCMDISLYKKVGGDTPESLHNPPVSISVTLSIPKDMRKEGRIYRLYRIHDNEVEYVQGVYFPAAYAFGFYTDKFSVYALTYDWEEGAEKPNIEPEKPAAPTTSPVSQTAPGTSGKTFPPELWGCLFFGALLIIGMARRRV